MHGNLRKGTGYLRNLIAGLGGETLKLVKKKGFIDLGSCAGN